MKRFTLVHCHFTEPVQSFPLKTTNLYEASLQRRYRHLCLMELCDVGENGRALAFQTIKDTVHGRSARAVGERWVPFFLCVVSILIYI